MTPKALLGEWAKEARQVRITERLTQVELAHHAGVSLGLVKRFEAGGGITLHAFVRMAMALGRGNALRELLRPPAPIPGLGVTQADLSRVSIADLEAAQSTRITIAKPRVRHSRKARRSSS